MARRDPQFPIHYGKKDHAPSLALRLNSRKQISQRAKIDGIGLTTGQPQPMLDCMKTRVGGVKCSGFRCPSELLGSLAALIISLQSLVASESPQFRPGQAWLDTSGKAIQAHGGGVLVHSNVYYWYGEDRSTPRTAVSCYVSTNLSAWRHLGVVFDPERFPAEFQDKSFIERPKVIYNPHTRKFVLWFHMEQRGYHFARAGVATSDTINGPFTFVHAIRPIRQDFGFKEDDVDRQKQLGGTFRDMTVFVDDDGKGYVFYASEGNWTLYIVRLNQDFTGPELPAVLGKTWARVLERQMREAPAPFKHQGKYYLVTSGCTGWKPNQAEYAVAENVLGPWTTRGNPCAGPQAEITFGAQSTFVLQLANEPGRFIFMSDRWNPKQLSDSRYVWLPLHVTEDDGVRIPWADTWDLSALRKR